MEGTHHQIARVGTDEFLNALLHLTSRFVGKRERHDSRRRNALLHHVRNLIGKYARLTRTRCCHNQRRTLGTLRCCTLRTI